MIIHNFFYNEDNQLFSIEFSLNTDDDNTYRSISISFNEVEFYSPTLIDETDMRDIDNNFIIELLEEYFKDNEYPIERLL